MELKYIIDKVQYLVVKQQWKNTNEHSATELILYNLLRGFPAKRGFTPITNKNKLANGATEWCNFESARFCVLRDLTEPTPSKWKTDAENAAMLKLYQDRLAKYGLAYSPELFAQIVALCKEQTIQ